MLFILKELGVIKSVKLILIDIIINIEESVAYISNWYHMCIADNIT